MMLYIRLNGLRKWSQVATRQTNARVPEELETAVRKALPELTDESLSVLVRTGLAVLAGCNLCDAIEKARRPISRRASLIQDYDSGISA